MMENRYIKLFLLTVLLYIVIDAPAQNQKEIDSLKREFIATGNDSAKIALLIKISKYYDDTDFELASNYVFKALELSKSMKQKVTQSMASRAVGDLYLKKGDHGSATSYYLNALEIDKEQKNITGEAEDYNLIGDIYYYQDRMKDALDNYNKALGINKRLDNKKLMSVNYNNIGIVYTLLKKYEKAIDCYNATLELSIELENQEGIAASYMNKSIVFFNKGEYSLAISNTEKAIEIELVLNKPERLLSVYSNLAEFYIANQQFDEAALALQKANEYVAKVPDKELLKGLYNNYVNLYKAQGNYQKAYNYGIKVLQLKDSIHKENNNRQAIELTAKHESDQKELEIKSLTNDATISEEALKQGRNFKIFLSLFVVLIIGSSVVLYRRIIIKRKTNKMLSAVHKQIEKKNQSITDSINYSKRIQDSILPSKQLKNKLFHESFILYMPKDIVSGDFYWYTEKNGKTIIACCDCTGHGVPGALMSMVGNNILNQVVNENEITSPDEILNHLHIEIRKALKQDVQRKSMDGMDLALIVFNNAMEIEYAGAQRPLWIVRKSTDTGQCELIEIKANKFSIGGYQEEAGKKFTKHTVSLCKGDCVYLFTDGYADQFGGKDEKKFMSKRLKELLISNYSNSISEQEKNITDAIVEWKGDHEQVDDIQMIGIRI